MLFSVLMSNCLLFRFERRIGPAVGVYDRLRLKFRNVTGEGRDSDHVLPIC